MLAGSGVADKLTQGRLARERYADPERTLQGNNSIATHQAGKVMRRSVVVGVRPTAHIQFPIVLIQ
jgi:hypothetical protein